MTLGPLRFTNALGGTADFIYPGPAIDMQSPASAGVVSGSAYLYYAQSLDMSQWEIVTGVATLAAGTWTFSRTAVKTNSLGTTAKINFGTPPQVFLVGQADGQIAFPATENASSDPNTLDDYEEGIWTPTVSFATPGNLAVTYSQQNGDYTKIGRLVSASFIIVTSAFTFTTASGQMQINGLPFAAVNDANFRSYNPLVYSGINKAGYSSVFGALLGNTSQLLVFASGMGVTVSAVATADAPTTSTVILGGAVNYAAPT